MKTIIILILSLITTGQVYSQIKLSDLNNKGSITGTEKIPVSGAGNPSITPNLLKTFITEDLDKADVGLENVDNTSDASKPVSTAQAEADALKIDKVITANRQSASYTLVLADAVKLVELNSASANNLTVPPNTSVAFPIGTQIMIAQYGAGQTTIVAGSGVTLRSDSGKLKIAAQYGAATIVKIAADEWYVFGNLTN